MGPIVRAGRGPPGSGSKNAYIVDRKTRAADQDTRDTQGLLPIPASGSRGSPGISSESNDFSYFLSKPPKSANISCCQPAILVFQSTFLSTTTAMASVLQRARDYTTSASVPSTTASSHLSGIQNGSASDSPRSTLVTVLAVIGALLVLEQTVYRLKKKHLPGAKWTIPVIGKFADSLSPTLEGYKRQWNSGALSAVSVFNMYVFSLLNMLSEAHLFIPGLSSLRRRTSTPGKL